MQGFEAIESRRSLGLSAIQLLQKQNREKRSMSTDSQKGITLPRKCLPG